MRQKWTEQQDDTLRTVYPTATWVEIMLALPGRDYSSDTYDHKVPLSRGGLHESDNLVLACRNCNFSKHTKTAEEFVTQRKDS